MGANTFENTEGESGFRIVQGSHELPLDPEDNYPFMMVLVKGDSKGGVNFKRLMWILVNGTG
jgi:hypothetical protein